MLIAIGAIGSLWPPMHVRGSVTTLTDTLHVVWAGIISLFIFLAIGFGSGAFGRRFRIYSFATIAVLLVSGTLTSLYGPRIAANQPTPGVGIFERIDLAGYLVWTAVLAIASFAPAIARWKPATCAGSNVVQRKEKSHDRPRTHTTLSCSIRRDTSRQHRRDLLPPTRRARSVGDDSWRERRQSAVDRAARRPGLSETGFFRHFNAPLEKSFTVVYWDQRGAGKSFDRNIPRSSMTVEQFIADLDELVDAVRKRLGQDQGGDLRALLGLGARRALRRALSREGRGLRRQRADRRLAGGASRRRMRSRSPKRSAAATTGAQEAARDRPAAVSAPKSVFVERTACRASRAACALRALWKAGTSAASPARSRRSSICPHHAWLPVHARRHVGGVSRLNSSKLVPALQMPVFFFSGARITGCRPRPAWPTSTR